MVDWEKCVLTGYEARVTGLRGSCVITSNRDFSWTSLHSSAILSSRRSWRMSSCFRSGSDWRASVIIKSVEDAQQAVNSPASGSELRLRLSHLSELKSGEKEPLRGFCSELTLMPQTTHSSDSKLASGNIEQLSIR